MVKYIHSIRLTDWYVCWNLSLNGILRSGKINQKNIFPNLKNNKNVNNSYHEITVTPTPTGITLLKNPDSRKAEVERNFEKCRKDKFPNLPSRLNSLWVAEDSINGKKYLTDMFKDEQNTRKILQIDILPSSVIHRADVQWFDKYFDASDENFILNYWKKLPLNINPKWEILIDGGFKISIKDIIFLRKHCIKNFVGILSKEIIEISYQSNPI
jgi:hypothetical protein